VNINVIIFTRRIGTGTVEGLLYGKIAVYSLMHVDVEALWLQVQRRFVKSLFVGWCYRPPCANSCYL